MKINQPVYLSGEMEHWKTKPVYLSGEMEHWKTNSVYVAPAWSTERLNQFT